MISVLDERHIARGYDPYNSADQPHMIAAVNARRVDALTDRMIRRGMQLMARGAAARAIARMAAKLATDPQAFESRKFP